METGWIVVKVTKKHVVLLNSIDGSFKNIHRSRTQIPLIGERFEYKENSKAHSKLLKIIAIACIFVFMFFPFRFYQSVNSQFAYVVALDINPSIEIYADKDLNVVGVAALNKDGENVINNIDYKKKSLFKTVKLIIDQCIQKNYLNQDKNGVIASTVISLQKYDSLKESDIKNSIQDSLSKNHISADINIAAGKKELVEEAHKSLISINKYRIYKELKNNGINLTMQEVKEKSIKELSGLENDRNNDIELFKKPESKKGNENEKPEENDYGKSDEQGGSSGLYKGNNENENKSFLNIAPDDNSDKNLQKDKNNGNNNAGTAANDGSNKIQQENKDDNNRGTNQNTEGSLPSQTDNTDMNTNDGGNNSQQEIKNEDNATSHNTGSNEHPDPGENLDTNIDNNNSNY